MIYFMVYITIIRLRMKLDCADWCDIINYITYWIWNTTQKYYITMDNSSYKWI